MKDMTKGDWIQLGLVFLMLLGFAMHGEARISTLEQSLRDEKEVESALVRKVDAMQDAITRLAERVSWRPEVPHGR